MSRLLLTVILLPAAPALQAACDLQAGLAAFQAAQRASAEELLRECSMTDEYAAAAYFHLGILARNAEELQPAEAELAAAVRLAPGNVPYRLEWAVTLEWQGQLSEAQAIYEEALMIEPGNLPARLGIARMEHWRGHLQRSLSIYRELSQEFPKHRGVQSGLAYALLADRKIEESRELFKVLLATDPEDASARTGLEMVNDLRNHQFEVQGGEIKDALGRDIRQFRLTYSATPSYALKWGFELIGRNGFVQPPESSGVPVNRAIKSSQALFGEYRFNAQTSAFVALRREELAGDEDQRKLHFELMHQPAEHHRLFTGVIPAWIDGNFVNALSYAGYVYEPGKKWNAMAQFFYGWDRQYPDSRALSLAWTRNYGQRNWLRLGASASETSGDRATSAFLNLRHHLNREWAISTSLFTNFSSNQHEINLGVHYEF